MKVKINSQVTSNWGQDFFNSTDISWHVYNENIKSSNPPFFIVTIDLFILKNLVLGFQKLNLCKYHHS